MKKIDINKSLIFSLYVEDFKNSLDYLHLLGYFSNSKDFSEYEEDTLDYVQVTKVTSSYYAFMRDGTKHTFKYFIPKSKVVFVEEEPKKKILRPFESIDELFAETGFIIGKVVYIKKFTNCPYEEKTILNGFRFYTDDEFHRIDVIFGSGSRTLDDLFKYYKYLKNGKWLRFGVEE